MRILHVNKFLYRRGGAEGYMLDVAELQRQAGHEVEFFGMAHPDNLPDLSLAHTFPPHIELEPPPPGAKSKVVAGARMVWSRSSEAGIRQALRAFRPDVVHCHNIYHQLSPAVLRPIAAAGVPCVMTLHDYKLACPNYQMLDQGRICDACVTSGPLQALRHRCKDGSLGASALLGVESWLHRRMGAYGPVDAFICPSQFLADVMKRAGVFPDRMQVVNHFVIPDASPPPSRPGLGFVFGGRLSHEKGIDVLIRAIGLSGPEVTLDIAGDGPQRTMLEELAAEVAPERVRFHGRIERHELQRLMRAAIASVVPSRWYENQPMTILESLGIGTPVIASRLGGIPELVQEGVNGWLVDPEDPRQLAQALSAAAASPQAARDMGLSGRRIVMRDLSADRHVERLDHIYRGQLSGTAADSSAASTTTRGV
ncbi:putative Glycosyl transferase group 1 [Nostocoides japonicum T1-X7]|uniref:Putative Glycosyl transferase group 1 n=1 Tax=Nostocoides japonicum T1-X7 TaxID=1194083 RepID=A0A077LYX2_9MICO|nr:glycosyltransferase family 4 protein [Tetrasphaera japonica]CCH79113.1 putative Glycosyl transferase group 1 [Tetrasphaera japonica T1-X7]